MFEETLLGIDIGSKEIKAVQVRQKRTPVLTRMCIFPTPEGGISEGEIKDADLLQNEIRKKLRENGINAKKASVCINSPYAVVREMKLPRLDESELETAVEFDLSQTFPGIGQTHSISFKEYGRDEEMIRGIVSFCPSRIIDGYMSLFGQLGMELRFIDIHANCIAKVYDRYVRKGKPEDCALLVHIGCCASEVDIIQNGQLLLSRNASCGLQSLDNLISVNTGISLEEAGKARTDGYINQAGVKGDMRFYITQSLSPLQDQIRQTMEFYSYNKYRESISGIYLSGGGSLLPGFDQHLKELFQLPVAFLEQGADKNASRPEFVRCVPAIGAAIREDER